MSTNTPVVNPVPVKPTVTPTPAPSSTPTPAKIAAKEVNTPKPEVKPEVKPVPKVENRDAVALQRARRIEAQARETEQRAKAEQAKLAQDRANYEAATKKAAEHDRLQELAKKNPREVLKTLGISEDDYLNMLAKDGQPKSTEEVANEIVEKKLAEREAKARSEAETKQKEFQAKQQELAQKQYEKTLSDIDNKIKNDPDRYEFCNQNPAATAQAWKLIEDYWNLTAAESADKVTGELLSLDEALDTIEADLEEKYDAFQKNSKKLKAKAEAEAKEKQEKLDQAAVATSANKVGKMSERVNKPMIGLSPKGVPVEVDPSVETATPQNSNRFRVGNYRARVKAWNDKISAAKAAKEKK